VRGAREAIVAHRSRAAVAYRPWAIVIGRYRGLAITNIFAEHADLSEQFQRAGQTVANETRPILGIDPGTAITGYALVSEDDDGLCLIRSGAIRTAAGTPLPERLHTIYGELSSLIDACQPRAVAVEKLFFSKNVRTAFAVGQARGVVLLAAAAHRLPVFEYGPNEVKQAISGYGGADKHQMQQMVKLLLDLDSVPQPDDVADAIAVAICHLHAARWKQIEGR